MGRGGGGWTNVWFYEKTWSLTVHSVADLSIDLSPMCDDPSFRYGIDHNQEHQHCLGVSHRVLSCFPQNTRLTCGVHSPGNVGLPHIAFIGQLNTGLSL